MALLAMQYQAAQLRAKTRGLTPPIAEQADRRDDQCRRGQPAGVFLNLDVRQCLQGFAQPHVVGQDAAQAVGAQKLQPVQALLLVGAQLGLQAGRHRHRGQFAAAAQALRQFTQRLRTGPHRAFAQTHCGAQGVEPRQLEAVARKIMAALAHQLQQRLQPGLQALGRQPHKAAVGLRQVHVIRQRRRPSGWVRRAVRGLRDQAGQPGQDVVALAVDLHAQRQVEPGRGAGVVALRLQRHLQAVGAGDPVLQVVGQRQLEAGLAQRAEVGIGPVQPALLRQVARDAEQAAVGRLQAQVVQPGHGVELGLGVAGQQKAALRVLHHHGAALAGPPTAVTGVIKLQLGLDQATVLGDVGAVARQLKAGARSNVAQRADCLQHRR